MTATSRRWGGTARRRGIVAACLACIVLVVGGGLAAGCGGNDGKVSVKRERSALQGRIEDELGSDVTQLSRTARPSQLAPGWRKVQDGAWFHPQASFVPTLFVIDTTVDAETTARDVLDGGRDHDAEANDNFHAVSATPGAVFRGGVPGIAYVNAYDIDGAGVTVTGELAIVRGHLYNAYITASSATTRNHGGEYRRMLSSIDLAAPATPTH